MELRHELPRRSLAGGGGHPLGGDRRPAPQRPRPPPERLPQLHDAAGPELRLVLAGHHRLPGPRRVRHREAGTLRQGAEGTTPGWHARRRPGQPVSGSEGATATWARPPPEPQEDPDFLVRSVPRRSRGGGRRRRRQRIHGTAACPADTPPRKRRGTRASAGAPLPPRTAVGFAAFRRRSADPHRINGRRPARCGGARRGRCGSCGAGSPGGPWPLPHRAGCRRRGRR
ncbi:hypothetical protein PSMK_09150 [Phycisphaera mikurensis NBRC 102666]|uniref:Uncharacterized protein n=1 Tax=Phycisphaera mikurensis (strain NBRC 102666 / KCTC 22515 / FYK2301M01) TaxID=1142394 RepID=I0ICT6_PHYMF|nr:hypothetical protein PSMK_09150 [Phycisphaera mikurensis NBRC 102666]